MTSEAENLDGMTDADLRAYLATVKPRSLLSQYARTELKARKARLAGSMTVADGLTRRCDALYKRLPKKDRW